jgi:two-component system NarL family sensor kinase
MEKWQDPETLAYWFGIIITFIVVLLTSIILIVRKYYKEAIKRSVLENELLIEHQRQLLETNISAQEKERLRIASDLHDSIISKLTVMRYQNQLSNDVEKMDQLFSESIKEARRISHDLSPPMIEHTSLNDLIKEITHPWETQFSLSYRMDLRNDFELNASKKTQFTRIIQEIITNITKHSEATTIHVHLRHTEHLLALKILDNGKGIDLKTAKFGLGLKNIESRVQYVNAKYKMKSKINHSTSFLIALNSHDNQKQFLTST